MNVLSLFDGMSCGQIALHRAGIKVDKYYASEIDSYAIKIAQKNYPDTIHLGDVRDVKASQLPQIDLLIAGSPCQGFSKAGEQLNFDHEDSVLFFEFIRLLKECKPKHFLLENVEMKREWSSIITEFVGVYPVKIDSALMSAQSRKRLYWGNWEFNKPQDKRILLADILEDAPLDPQIYQRPHGFNKGGIRGKNGKTPTLTASSWHHNNLLLVRRAPKRMGIIGKGAQGQRIYSPFAKSPSIVASGAGSKLMIALVNKLGNLDEIDVRRLTPIECERLQTVPDDYTKGVSATRRRTMLGNGWTVDVIAHILECLKNDHPGFGQSKLL